MSRWTIQRRAARCGHYHLCPKRQLHSRLSSSGSTDAVCRFAADFRRAARPRRASDEVTFAYPMSESQQKLLSSQDFRDRIAPVGLRYRVLIGEKEMITRDTRLQTG